MHIYVLCATPAPSAPSATSATLREGQTQRAEDKEDCTSIILDYVCA